MGLHCGGNPPKKSMVQFKQDYTLIKVMILVSKCRATICMHASYCTVLLIYKVHAISSITRRFRLESIREYT